MSRNLTITDWRRDPWDEPEELEPEEMEALPPERKGGRRLGLIGWSEKQIRYAVGNRDLEVGVRSVERTSGPSAAGPSPQDVHCCVRHAHHSRPGPGVEHRNGIRNTQAGQVEEVRLLSYDCTRGNGIVAMFFPPVDSALAPINTTTPSGTTQPGAGVARERRGRERIARRRQPVR